MHQYIVRVSVYRQLCGPVDGQVDQFHLKVAVDVWGAVVSSVEDHWSIDGRLNIVKDWEKWRLHL